MRSRSSAGPSTTSGSANFRTRNRCRRRRRWKRSGSGTSRWERRKRSDATVRERNAKRQRDRIPLRHPRASGDPVSVDEKILGPRYRGNDDQCEMKHDFQELKLDRVTRRFAGAGGHAFAALNELTLTIRRGEFIALLGPSGCGKSTALNCIAGLMPLSGGTIHLDEQRIDTLPPERRGFGMVFQNYALFPHMSVARNVGFGLRMRGLPHSEIEPRVSQALGLVQLTGQAHKL